MPAKVLTIAQQKGGAGKSTLAAQLAVTYAKQGKRTALLDIDPQGSVSKWFEQRETQAQDVTPITFLQASGWRLTTEIDRLKTNHDIIIVDSPPHAETDVRIAVRAADLIMVPMQPSPLDLWATGPTLELARKEKSKALVVFNRTPAKGKLVDDIRLKIEQDGLPVAQCTLGNRVAFAASMLEGKGVVETTPRHAASVEINALAQEIAAQLGL